MEQLISTLGAIVVSIALRDVFHTLWHPSGRGTLSRLANAAVWWMFRHADRHGRLASLTGPLAMASVIVVWGLLVIVGWTLVYWPHLPEAFTYQPGQSPRAPLLDALYLSTVTVATLGFGDIVPVEGWLQIAVPLEALIGFALLSAAVSWVLQIYPALTRRRALALRLTLLDRGCAAADIRDLAPAYAEQLSELGMTADDPNVRLAGSVLRVALDDLAAVIDEQFLHTGAAPAEVLATYAADCGVRRR